MLPAEAVARFRTDFERLSEAEPDRIGIAVSGGPDSLALLLLAHAAYPRGIEAATVDHRLRPESGQEAAHVEAVCRGRGIDHTILRLEWPEHPAGNLQARARRRRYEALQSWASSRGLRWLATGHHQEDQAETLLMRLARGAGIDGLAGIRSRRPIADGVWVVRPLLTWSRSELAFMVDHAGVEPIDDPTNRSEAHDRTRFRALLTSSDLLPPARIAAAARNLAAAQEVVRWAEDGAWRARFSSGEQGCRIDASLLPAELERRLLIRAIDQLRNGLGLCETWRTDKLPTVMQMAAEEGRATIAGILLEHEKAQCWRLTVAPPRRS